LGTDTAYAELGLAPGATEREVKAAWRRLVSLWHPDRNDQAGALVRMQRINLAFEALRRAGFPVASDGSTAGGVAAEAAADAPSEAPPTYPSRPSRPSADAAEPAAAPRRSRTVNRKLKLTLEEAALGCTKLLRGKASRATCADCAGTGSRPSAMACRACDGAGSQRQRGWYGLFGSSASPCAACSGSGREGAPCASCDGAGQLSTPGYRVSVRLPPGVRDGDQLQVDGRRMRPNPSAGDLLIRVQLLPHALFTLADDDTGNLHCTLPVNGFAWLANRPVLLPTLSGPDTLVLDRAQRDYRLPCQGIPATRRGPRGDLLVHLEPCFPDRLSVDQEILLDQLVATGMGPAGAAAEARLGAWQQRLKDWQHDRQTGSD
jgi:molecular chaperone DnaJ